MNTIINRSVWAVTRPTPRFAIAPLMAVLAMVVALASSACATEPTTQPSKPSTTATKIESSKKTTSNPAGLLQSDFPRKSMEKHRGKEGPSFPRGKMKVDPSKVQPLIPPPPSPSPSLRQSSEGFGKMVVA